MTTKLDSPVTRLTTIVVDGREVDVTLVPGSELNPEMFEFHQKGLKSSKQIPIAAVLKAIGWNVSKKILRADKNTEMDALLDELEVALKPWREAA